VGWTVVYTVNLLTYFPRAWHLLLLFLVNEYGGMRKSAWLMFRLFCDITIQFDSLRHSRLLKRYVQILKKLVFCKVYAYYVDQVPYNF